MAEKMDILIDKDDGKMRMVRLAPGAILDSDVVPADHPTRKALEVGRSLIEPPEPVGVEWLKSLPVWTILRPIGQNPILITKHGFQYQSGDAWTWAQLEKSWSLADWIYTASPKTCPEWTPEENNDGKD